MNTTPDTTRPQPTLSQALRAFHEDQDGMEALQVVMIVGIAAVLLLLINMMFPSIRKWVVDNVKTLLGFKAEKPDLPE